MSLSFVSSAITEYASQCSSPESELLAQIRTYTQAQVADPDMLSGHLQGRILATISRLIAPQRVLEIGTYTGYATLCLAEGLRPDGELHTIDNNPQVAQEAQRFFEQSPYNKPSNKPKQIHMHLGNAHQIIPQLAHEAKPFDLVFIDADKTSYPQYYELIRPMVRQGGCIIADNVLWSGKVLEESTDENTLALQAFNALVHADPTVHQVILPVRDGLSILCKL